MLSKNTFEFKLGLELKFPLQMRTNVNLANTRATSMRYAVTQKEVSRASVSKDLKETESTVLVSENVSIHTK